MSDDGGKIIFQYQGLIYSRPLGRSIVFGEGELAKSSLYLEDKIPEGYFELDVTVRRPKKS